MSHNVLDNRTTTKCVRLVAYIQQTKLSPAPVFPNKRFINGLLGEVFILCTAEQIRNLSLRAILRAKYSKNLFSKWVTITFSVQG